MGAQPRIAECDTQIAETARLSSEPLSVESTQRENERRPFVVAAPRTRSADATSYCLQLTQGAVLQHLAGTGWTPQPDACWSGLRRVESACSYSVAKTHRVDSSARSATASARARPTASTVSSMSRSVVDQFDTEIRRRRSPRHVVAPSQHVPSA